MTNTKVGKDKYINVDRMTYVEPARGDKLIVRFDLAVATWLVPIAV
jgi:hypothetical protein